MGKSLISLLYYFLMMNKPKTGQSFEPNEIKLFPEHRNTYVYGGSLLQILLVIILSFHSLPPRLSWKILTQGCCYLLQGQVDKFGLKYWITRVGLHLKPRNCFGSPG